MDRDGKQQRTAWHRAAFARHITRVPDDFPDPRSSGWWVFFGPWSEALDDLKVSEPEFEAASRRISRDPPSHPNKHLKALLEAIEFARRSGIAVPNDRDQAAKDSQGCEQCGGGGLASRDHEHPERGRYAVSYHCTCPLGRWIKGQYDRDPKAPKLRDLAHYPELQWRAEDPVDHRHLEIGRWFQARAKAITQRKPLPPKPEAVREIDDRNRKRFEHLKPSTATPRTVSSPLFEEPPHGR